MPVGRMLREDQVVKEGMTARGTTSADKAMMDALCGAEGIMAAGALPSVKAASEEGQKKLLQAMDDEGKPVKKAPKNKNKETEENPEPVRPKTTAESCPQMCFEPSYVQGSRGISTIYRHLRPSRIPFSARCRGWSLNACKPSSMRAAWPARAGCGSRNSTMPQSSPSPC